MAKVLFPRQQREQNIAHDSNVCSILSPYLQTSNGYVLAASRDWLIIFFIFYTHITKEKVSFIILKSLLLDIHSIFVNGEK